MVIIRLITGVVVLAALILASQAVYVFMLGFKRWPPGRRSLFLAIAATTGLFGFLLTLAPSTAEAWVAQLFAIGLTFYLASCLAIWMNRVCDPRPKPSWLLQGIVFLVSQVFFILIFVIKIVLTRAGLIVEIEFAVLTPFAFGLVCGHGLSNHGSTNPSSTALSAQALWWVTYLWLFSLLVKLGGFWSIPYLAMMILFFPGIMMLVLLGTWLGSRCSEILSLPQTQRNWIHRLLDPRTACSLST